LRQVHWISGSKSSSASDGSCRVVTETKAKVKVESFPVGARELWNSRHPVMDNAIDPLIVFR
jgi:hypothetical protein